MPFTRSQHEEARATHIYIQNSVRLAGTRTYTSTTHARAHWYYSPVHDQHEASHVTHRLGSGAPLLLALALLLLVTAVVGSNHSWSLAHRFEHTPARGPVVLNITGEPRYAGAASGGGHV